MAKVTGKFQITLPKALVDECGIRIGDELELQATGRSIQITRRPAADALRHREARLALFDRATMRLRGRAAGRPTAPRRSHGWTREELYTRGRSR